MKFYACYAAPDRKQQIEILVDIAAKTKTETGIVYPDFKTAEKALTAKNANGAQK